MQDRYTGDVGDFGKYALLRALAAQDLRLGVVWYLNAAEEANTDGGLTQYLFEPKKSRALGECDPWLYRQMLDLVCSKRQVSQVAKRQILPDGSLFFERALPVSEFKATTHWRSSRVEWCQAALYATREADFVFLDPDNGLASRPITSYSSRSSLKYAFLDELQPYLQRGQSIVLYHHQTRHGTFIQQLERNLICLQRLSHTEKPWAVTYHRGQARAYFVVANPKHRSILAGRCIAFVQSMWGKRGHFKTVGLSPEVSEQTNQYS